MKNMTRALKMLILSCVLILGLGIAMPGYAAPEALKDGNRVKAYPLKKGTISVYEDADLSTVKETVSGKNLLVTITKAEGAAYYGSYKSGKKTVKGWFTEKTFIRKPSFEKKDGLARYAINVYRTKAGSSWGKIKGYSDLDVIGKSGKWYQVIYPVKKIWQIGWIKAADYSSDVRLFDGTEKRIMAEGTYVMRPKSGLTDSVTASGGALALQKAKKAANQQFVFTFFGDNRYQISALKSGTCLAAETDESGAFTGAVVLAETDSSGPKAQLWELTRKGGYYYLRNQATGRYLKAGDSFRLAGKSSAGSERFRLTMVGKNKNHWQVFSQYDPLWGGKYYGRTNTMAGAACGILSMVNALYALNGQFIDPMTLASFAVKKHYRIEGSGTVSTVFMADSRKFGQDYGFKCIGSTTSMSKLKKHLKSGGTAIAYVPGHYMAVGDYKGGKYLALDSAATAKRATSPYGLWINGSRLQTGSLNSKAFFLFKAID